ncbi:hypothetical protein QU593_09790 [Rossellomorea marisflavi]|uniref:hypothetical protein n=1 Tax=Rossellomorea marisflavi TaxID=189381 RepID=UPI0025AF41E2|nr:hypothetical protein [Rossellomorea marisflavi]WJV20694.1 hypothetical protein QU593_09790 [Rossellomorea marisflavi]
MGMKQKLESAYTLLTSDEQIARLLYYPPSQFSNNFTDPLSPTLPNIQDMEIEARWDILDKRIKPVPKSLETIEEELCLLFIYAGLRQPTNNYYTSTQEIIIDVLCHENYEKDSRSAWLSDRINEVLDKQRIAGFGKVSYVSGRPISAPQNFVGFRHIFKVGELHR